MSSVDLTEFGNIWTAKDSFRQWAGVSLSSSGQYQTALVNGGQIYISSDFGNNWSPKDSNRGWREVSLSSSGQYQTAIVNVGNIYVSNDFGNRVKFYTEGSKPEGISIHF